MNVSDIIESVQRQFGDETGAQIDAADVIRWINEGELLILRKTEALETQVDLNLAASPATNVQLPADFFKLVSVDLGTDKKRLQLISIAQLRSLYPNYTTDPASNPKFIAVQGSLLWFAPKSSVATPVTVRYVSRPPVVNSTLDSLSISPAFHPTLLTYCLAKAKQLDGDMSEFITLNDLFNKDLGEDAHDAKTPDAETFPFIRTSLGDSW